MFSLNEFGVRSFESVSIVQLFAKALKIKVVVSRLVFAFIFYILNGQLSNEGEPQIILRKKKSGKLQLDLDLAKLQGFRILGIQCSPLFY